MKIGWIVRLGVLGLFIASCSPAGATQAPPAQVIATSTAAISTKAPATATLAASPTTPPQAVPTSTTAPAVISEQHTIALVDLKISAATTGHYRLVDALTGETQADLVVKGLTEGPQIVSAGDSIFNVDGETHAVRRIRPDGVVEPLAFTNPGGKLFQGAFLPSPDGRQIAWSVLQAIESGGTRVQLKVASSDGSGEKTLIDEKRAFPTRPDPVRWSRDGKSLYFSNAPYGIGGYILFAGWTDLQKVDLSTGQVQEILPQRGCMCALSLSPDESRIAMINRPEADFLELILLDVASGEKKKVRLPSGHSQAGAIQWSPDGTELLVTAAIGNPDKEAYSIIKLDADTLDQTPLVTDDPRNMEAAAWPLRSTVWLNDRNGDAWRMDPSTGALVKAAQGEHVVPASQ